MKRWKFLMLCAALVAALCGAAWAEVSDIVISGDFAAGYTVNTWYSSSITVSGGEGALTFNITSGDIPPGFFLRKDGENLYLEGVPGTAKTWNFTLRVTDRHLNYAERDLSVTIQDKSKADDMVISGDFAAGYTVSTWYSSYVTVEGYNDGFTFKITSGDIPSGFFLRKNENRLYLEGIPSTARTWNFRVKVTDGQGRYTERDLSVTVEGERKADDMLISGDFETAYTVSNWYSSYVTVEGYNDGFTFKITSGDIPSGFFLRKNENRLYLEGIPSTARTWDFRVKVTDSKGRYTERDLSVTVEAKQYAADSGDMYISGALLVSGEVGTWYDNYTDYYDDTERVIYVNGGTPDYTFTVDRPLPKGMYIRQDKHLFWLEGIPTEAGDVTFVLRILDRRNSYVEKSFTVSILAGEYTEPTYSSSMSITDDFTTEWKMNESYSSSVSVRNYSGFSSNLTLSVVSGDLPPGLSLRKSYSSIYLEGIPNTGGDYKFTLRATDNSVNAYTEKTFTVSIIDTPYKDETMAISGDFRAEWMMNESYSSCVSFSGYSGEPSSVTLSVVSGDLPPGLSLRREAHYSYDGDIYLEGIPNTSGDYKFTLRVTDSRNAYAEKTFTVRIIDTPYKDETMAILGDFRAEWMMNKSYLSSVSVSFDSSRASLTALSVVSGDLPPGLSLRKSYSSIYLEGIPNTGGDYKFTLRATDSRNAYAEKTFTVRIIDTPYDDESLVISGNFESEWKMNESYSSSVSVSFDSSRASLTALSVVSGDLPPGLSLRREAHYSYDDDIYYYDIYLYGIPNTAGDYTFTLRATDSMNAYTEKTFTVSINDTQYIAPDILITGSLTDEWTVNERYTGYLNVSGYKDSFNATVAAGMLPPGLSLMSSESNMYLTGIPTAGGIYTFILRVTDKRNYYAEREFTITVYDTPHASSEINIVGDFTAVAWVVNSNNSVSAYLEGCYSDTRLTVAKGALPPGLSLSNPYNYNGRTYFTLYGIPNAPGDYTFTLRATSNTNAYTEREFTLTVTGDTPADPVLADDMVISGDFAEGRTISNWYSESVSVIGGVQSYTFKITDGALPPGFYFRRLGSRIYLEGIPDTAGTYTFKLRVIDQLNTYAEREFTVKISSEHSRSQQISITGSFPDAYTVNTWYSEKVQISGGNPPYTVEVTSGDLPSGFRLRNYSDYYYSDRTSLYLEGIPTKPGTYSFTIQATDRSNQYAECSFDITISGDELTTPTPSSPIAINTDILNDALTGREYTQKLEAEGTVTSWIVTDDDLLPPGLSLNETTGVISGTVDYNAIEHNTDLANKYTFVVMATNTMSGLAEKTFTISVSEPLKFADGITLPKARVKDAYEAVITVDGTLLKGISFTVSCPKETSCDKKSRRHKKSSLDDEIPDGLSYYSDGRTCFITGTPKTAGTYTLYVDADNGKTVAETELMLIIDPEPDPVSITTRKLDPAVAGREYSQDIEAEGTVTSWRLTDGSLPAGLSLDASTGRISGTVDVKAAGHNERHATSYTFEVTVSNDSGSTTERSFTLKVSEPLTFTQGTALPDGMSGKEYETSITADGTLAGGIKWECVGLPDGLDYTYGGRTCVIRGTPSRAGTHTVTLLAYNGLTTISQDLTLSVKLNQSAVRPRISLQNGVSSVVNAGNTLTIQPAVTGTTPITWTLEGDIPSGLAFNAETGRISGIVGATDEGRYAHNHVTYSFTLTASNLGGSDSVNSYISVWYPPSFTTDLILPSAKINNGYITNITAEGTEYGMKWEKISGTIPKGMKLTTSKNSRTAILTGTPQSTGTFTFTLKLSNSAGSATRSFTLTIDNDTDSGTGKPKFTTPSLPEGETGVPYTAILEASGKKPITWSKSGSFPKGLKLDKHGNISGVPTKKGSYTFTLIARNKLGATPKKFTVVISGDSYSKPKITTLNLPEATANSAYDVQLEAKGTDTELCPITWSFVGSKYPAGLYITDDGRITGIPEEAGKFIVKVKAENNIGSATKTYNLKVNGLVPEILNENLPSGKENADYTVQLQAEGSDPIKWKKSGSFPKGLTLGEKTGTITGKPTAAGTYSFKITASNKFGRHVKDFTIIVEAAPSSSAELPETATENAHRTSVQYAVPEEKYSQPDAESDGSEIDLWVVSGDEELRGEIYAPEGQPLTFMIGAWPGSFEEAEVYIADEAIAIEIADDGTFILPGELVYDEFVIYVMAGNTKTIELYIVAEKEE